MENNDAIDDKDTKRINEVNLFIVQYFRCVFYCYTIDSFRPKYANSHIILEELRYVCECIEKGVISETYLKGIRAEAKNILSKDILLDKKYAKKRQIIIREIYSNSDVTYLKQFVNIELGYFRKKYQSDLADELLSHCDKRSNKTLDYELEEELRSIINSFISECIYSGVSFMHLKKLADFKDSFSKTDITALVKKFLGRNKFNVYLMLRNVDVKVFEFFKEITQKSPIVVSREWPLKAARVPNKLKINDHRKESTMIVYSKRISSKDKHSALLRLTNSLEDLVNLAHILNPSRGLQFNYIGLVYDYSQRRYTQVNYEKVVDYRHKFDSDEFNKKITFLMNVSDEIRNKILSSASYLDISLNEYKPTNRFLNSWISIEVLFNGIKKERPESRLSTIDYIYKYTPIISSVFYIHKIIKYLGNRVIEKGIEDINKDITIAGKLDEYLFIKFLRKPAKRDYFNRMLSTTPELVHKVDHFMRVLSDQKILYKALEEHRISVEYHLSRLYRIRNDIVHGGEQAIQGAGLTNLTSIIMLSINSREYSTEVMMGISEFCHKNKQSRNEEVTRIVDVLESFVAIYNVVKGKLNRNEFNDEDLERLLLPMKFLG